MNYIKKHIILFLFGISIMGCQTDWSENFNMDSTEPFGTYIFHEEIKSLFPESIVEDVTQYFDDFQNNTDKSMMDIIGNSFISIQSQNYNFDSESFDVLIDHVETGNNVFLAYNDFGDDLCELLEIETTNKDATRTFSSNMKHLEGLLTIKGSDKTYEYDRNLRFHYISAYNSETTQVLGNVERDGESFPCFIQIKYNNGNIFVHTQPIAFTNYFLLKKQNAEYVENVFSKLGHSSKTYWDDSPKFQRNREQEKEPPSALSFFMKHKALRWSLYTAFLGLLTFILINMRRKQRAIRIIKPLKNTTVEFTRTMANLYKKENNPKILVDKKINYFLHAVRHQYLLDTNVLDNDFMEKLASKSGNTIESTSILIKAINRLNGVQVCDEDELMRLNKLIENFFEK